MMRAFLITFVILILLGAGGWFGYNALFPQYHIVRTYRTGETWEYVIRMDMSSPLGSLKIPMKMRTTTRKVHPDGSAELENKFSVGQGASPILAQQLQAIDGQTMREKADRYSRKTPLGGSLNADIVAAGDTSETAYPTKPVRKGAKWEETKTQNGVTVKSINRVTGIEEMNGRECYKVISELSTVGNAPSQVSGTITTYIDRETGWTLRTSGSMNISAQGNNAVMMVSLDGKRIASGKPAPPKKQPVNKK